MQILRYGFFLLFQHLAAKTQPFKSPDCRCKRPGWLAVLVIAHRTFLPFPFVAPTLGKKKRNNNNNNNKKRGKNKQTWWTFDEPVILIRSLLRREALTR